MDRESPPPPAASGASASSIATLVERHRDFLRYVERRVGGDRALAAEIVQDAFVRALDRGGDVDESIVGWFYRVLRNAIVDRKRRQAVADRRLEAFAAELSEVEPELEEVACRCLVELAATLKPEYADALTRIEVDGVAVKDYAEAVGISASNAGVRIFRAREALRQQVARACGTCATHGCFDCSCETAPPA